MADHKQDIGFWGEICEGFNGVACEHKSDASYKIGEFAKEHMGAAFTALITGVLGFMAGGPKASMLSALAGGVLPSIASYFAGNKTDPVLEPHHS